MLLSVSGVLVLAAAACGARSDPAHEANTPARTDDADDSGAEPISVVKDASPPVAPDAAARRRVVGLPYDAPRHNVAQFGEPHWETSYTLPFRACKRGEKPIQDFHGLTCYENPASGPPTPTFDRARALAALQETEERAVCYADAGMPTNIGYADLTIQPDGRVAVAWLSPSFESATGRCLAATWNKARVRPFRSSTPVVLQVHRSLHVD